MECSSHIFRKPSKKPALGSIQPIFPTTGSIMIAAISLGNFITNASTAARSLYAQVNVSFETPAVTPGTV